MSSAGPISNDPADVARWQQEREQEADRLADEQQFREEMRGFAARADTTLTHIQQAQAKHDADDALRFKLERRARKRLARRVESLSGQVTQTVNTTKYNWGVAAAWVSAFVAVASVGWALIEKFGGGLKP